MSPIVKAFGRYLDLRKVVSIGFAEFYESDSRAGYSAQVGFDILVQRCKPIEYRRPLVEHVEIRRDLAKGWGVEAFTIAIAAVSTIDQDAPSFITAKHVRTLEPPVDVLAVLRLQREIDAKIIDPWHEIANHSHVRA